MITTPTVLVLGAGTSLAYGFPLGHDLLRRIASGLNGQGYDQIVADASGQARDKVKRFAGELLQARRSSIDAFIESRATDYDEIGRCAIAHHLLALESDDKLYPPLNQDWYTALFDAILGHSADAFRRNQLKVVTFNFDRSFERALYLALSVNFAGEDIDRLMDVIPVLHVHGDLGHPSWQKRHIIPGMRPYEPAQDVPNIKTCAQRIKIVHHGITDGTSATIQEWFAWCHRVFFIGFSYQESNLRKLRIPGSLRSKTAVGTSFGMGEGLRSRVRRLTEDSINMVPFEWTAIDAVQRYDWFYEG